jgi:hypothetical protein
MRTLQIPTKLEIISRRVRNAHLTNATDCAIEKTGFVKQNLVSQGFIAFQTYLV